MPMSATSRRLTALFVLGLLAFFSPVLGAFNRPLRLPGSLPLFPTYIFLVWAGLNLAAWWVVRKGSP
jgi:hypothetical protein